MISVEPGSSSRPVRDRGVCTNVGYSGYLTAGRGGPALLTAVQEYRAAHPLSEVLRPRIPTPAFTYYGKEVWEQALAAILCGENLLLAGGKATGKNVLAENLAAAFGRPAWDISFHVNMDAASLIGMDTFAGGQVVFRPGPVYRCAQCGGFGVLDEINMAKNEALAVLHAVLDFRRAIDVPGYDRIPLAEETRFIATMNYGYAGTRELNEALTSRFAVCRCLPSRRIIWKSCCGRSSRILPQNMCTSLHCCFWTCRKNATVQKFLPKRWICAVCWTRCG